MSTLEKMARRLALDALDRVKPGTYTSVVDGISLYQMLDGNYQVGERLGAGDEDAPGIGYDTARETMVAMMAEQAGALVVVPEEVPMDNHLAQIAQLLVDSADVDTDAQDVADGAAIVGTVKRALDMLYDARGDVDGKSQDLSTMAGHLKNIAGMLVASPDIAITDDDLRENNSTYRITWSEMVKDGTKMGVGLPEYVLLFRKMQSDISRMYADTPVVHTKEEYPVSRWQIDAHAFWRSSGDRIPKPEEVAALPPERLVGMEGNQVYRWYSAFSRNMRYDYERHLAAVVALDEADRLPKTYGLMLPQAPAGAMPTVWTDVITMRTLNMEQANRRVENHVCPLPFDIVDRCIERWSNPGKLVYDPFGGLMTVPYRAIKLGRRGLGVELNPEYWEWGCKYLEDAEAERSAPSLLTC